MNDYLWSMNHSAPLLDQDKLYKVAKILKAIAHPVKLQILQILGENGPLDVSSLCSKVGMDCQISMMSHHLSKMKDNGIVTSNKIGKQVYYQLADAHILQLFNCIDHCDLV